MKNLPFVILDRDGVINYESHAYIKSPDEWLPIPGSLEAIAALNRAGIRVVVATNQSGVGRGYYDLETLEKIHDKLRQELKKVGGHVDDIFFCPHQPLDNCVCRKPQPGLFQNIQLKFGNNLSNTYFIGDSLSDVLVAQSVGCQFLLVMTGNGEKTIASHPELASIPHFSDLAAAVQYILSLTKT